MTDDPRIDFRRRLRGVMRRIDDTLALHNNNNKNKNNHHNSDHIKQLSRIEKDEIKTRESFSLVPHISSWTELRSEQRRRELHTQREEAQRMLETLKRARAKREKLKMNQTIEEEITQLGVERLENNLSFKDLKQKEKEGENIQEKESMKHQSVILLPTRSPPIQPDLVIIDDQDQNDINNYNNNIKHKEINLETIEEAARQRISERRATEEKKLSKLRALQISSIARRHEALAAAEAEISKVEFEYLEKMHQLEASARQSAETAEKYSTLTSEEKHAIEIHKKELHLLRARTGIKAITSSPLRQPPPPPPQSDNNIYSSSFLNEANIISNSNREFFKPQDDENMRLTHLTSSFSMPQYNSNFNYSKVDKINDSPVKLQITSLPSPCESCHTLRLIEKTTTSDPLGKFSKRNLEDVMSISHPKLLKSSNSEVLLPFPENFNKEKEDEIVLNTPLRSIASYQAGRLISPSISLKEKNNSEKNEIFLEDSPSKSNFTLKGRGIVVDVLPSQRKSIPALVRFSPDNKELLLQVERIERNNNNNNNNKERKDSINKPRKFVKLPSSSLTPRRSRSIVSSSPERENKQQQNQEKEKYNDKIDSITRRIREVYHFPLLKGILLYPFGIISGNSSIDVSGILCGEKARKLLINFSCTIFASPTDTPYYIYLISTNTSSSLNTSTQQSVKKKDNNSNKNNTRTLLVLRFRNRYDWSIFLIAASEATRRSQYKTKLSFGRTLWFLLAQRWWSYSRHQHHHEGKSKLKLSTEIIKRKSNSISVENKNNNNLDTSRSAIMTKHCKWISNSVLSFSSDNKISKTPSRVESIKENYKKGKEKNSNFNIIHSSNTSSSSSSSSSSSNTNISRKSQSVPSASRRFVLPTSGTNDNYKLKRKLRGYRRFGLKSSPTNLVRNSSSHTENWESLMNYGY